MTFREFMQKYKKKRKRIGNVSESNTEFFYCLARFAEKHLKKAYNAGYEEGWNKCINAYTISKAKEEELWWRTIRMNHSILADYMKQKGVKNENI